jgi:hypothetical protein
MRNRNKRENGGHRPAGDEGFEPSRHKIRAQADIRKGDDGQFKTGAYFGKDFLSLTESAPATVEASLKKLLAFSRA